MIYILVDIAVLQRLGLPWAAASYSVYHRYRDCNFSLCS